MEYYLIGGYIMAEQWLINGQGIRKKEVFTLEEKEAALSKLWGRHIKYETEYCDMLIEHMSKGLSISSFAAKIKVCYGTIRKWVKEYPEFAAAHDVGQACKLQTLEAIGMKLSSQGGGNATAWRTMMSQNGWTELNDNPQQPSTPSVKDELGQPIINEEERIERLARIQQLKAKLERESI